MGVSVSEPSLPPEPGVARGEADAWSYVCGRCGGCCKGREFLVNPYDVARLSEGLGLGVADIARRYLYPSRPALLNVGPDLACVFYRAGEGCTVHAHRPAVCRFYPLGRHVTADRQVLWVEAEPSPGHAGTYGRAGPLAAYLEGQGAPPYIAALERLNAFMDEALAACYRAGALVQADDLLGAVWAGEAGFLPAAVLDVDSLTEPAPLADALDRLEAHLAALRRQCGLTLSPQAQVRLGETDEGRQTLFRLVQATALIGAGLGVAPGFSRLMAEAADA
jgi:Fe-S-cluster containining protein